MTIEWTEGLRGQALDLRVNYDLGWPDICVMLGLPHDKKEAVRIKVNRLIAAGADIPEKGSIEHDWSPLEEGETTRRQAPVLEVPYAKRDYSMRTDAETGQSFYQFVLNGSLIEIDEEVWQDIIAMYSADGADLTQYEVAAEVGLNKKELQQLLAKYGHFKARPPVTREELASALISDDPDAALEELESRAIEAEERRFGRRLSKRKFDFYRKNYYRMKEADEARATFIEELREVIRAESFERALPQVEKLGPLEDRHISGEGVSYHTPIFDPHFGLKVEGAMGWSGDYDLQRACAYLCLAADLTAERIRDEVGRAETIYATNGGDIFHAMLRFTETFSHVLERDRPDMIVWRAVIRVMKYRYERLRTVCDKLFIVDVPGNHGHIFDELITEFMAEHFRDADDVEVDLRLGQYKHFRIGKSLHVLDHGKGVNQLNHKAAAHADVTARVVAKEDFHGAESVYYYVGHLHHVEAKGHGPHLEMIRVPTFSHADDYAGRLRANNKPMVMVFRLDSDGDVVDTHRFLMTKELEKANRMGTLTLPEGLGIL